MHYVHLKLQSVNKKNMNYKNVLFKKVSKINKITAIYVHLPYFLHKLMYYQGPLQHIAHW